MEILAAIFCIYIIHLVGKRLDSNGATKFVEKMRSK